MITISRLAAAGALAWTIAVTAAPAAAQGATPWQTVRPGTLTLTGHTSDALLAEASGAAASVANPGLFWTLGDSGNPAELLAIDSVGTLVGRIVLEAIPNRDWEAVSVGPCGDSTCVYVADTGDNRERRSDVSVHRLVEPTVTAGASQRIGAVETLRLRYSQGPHDVEAMGVFPDGSMLLVTKGRSGGVLGYRVAADAWAAGTLVVAVRSDSLPIVADQRSGRLVTDLAIDRSGRQVAVRTYRDVYIFAHDSSGKLLPERACDILGAEPQGEGITWLADGGLLLVSERGLFKRGTVNILDC